MKDNIGQLFEDLLTPPEDETANTKSYIKENGMYMIKLADGRLWCPSRQHRGDTYHYEEYTLKKQENINFKTKDFVAFDFETATMKDKMPCQIGIVVVENGAIVKKIVRLIQPPRNIYAQRCINVHGITPNQTINEPEFDVVWNDIKQYIEGAFLVTHNASFDISVLENALDLYDIKYPKIEGYACTMKLYHKMKLDKACEINNITLENHHNALSDAEACAKLYLKHISM